MKRTPAPANNALVSCGTCGAAVANPTLHRAWHLEGQPVPQEPVTGLLGLRDVFSARPPPASP